MAKLEKDLLGELLLGTFGNLHKGDTITLLTGETPEEIKARIAKSLSSSATDPNMFYLEREGQ
jgi:hypothetical protein